MMNLNLLYIAINDFSDPQSAGVKKKILGEISALKKFGFNVILSRFEENRLIIQQDGKITPIWTARLRKLRRIKMYQKILGWLKSENRRVDVLYLRYPLMDPFLKQFLKTIKNRLNCISIIEIPTFPYDKEPKKLLRKLTLHNLDKIYRKGLNTYVNLVVSPSSESKIFSITNIYIQNGIDIKNIKLHKRINLTRKTLNIIGVANLSHWHGYDRVIEGLREYNSKEKQVIKTVFHVVGNGQALNQLKNLVEKYNLQQYVIFHGFKIGDELDKLFNSSHIAIGSLGVHRKGLMQTAELKAREYCARGIPFVCSSYDPDFPEDFPFVFRVSPDETPLNIESIINFYKEISEKYPDYPVRMRKYAEKNLTWDVKMKPIIDKIKELLNNNETSTK